MAARATALRRADEHGALGTGNPSLKARWLSITASLQTDQGDGKKPWRPSKSAGRSTLSSDWPLGPHARQMAHCIADHDPERALAFLDRANVSIPPRTRPSDPGLRRASAPTA